MEALRNWLLGSGWSEEGASVIAALGAVVLSIAIGGLLRRLAHVPIKRLIPDKGTWRHLDTVLGKFGVLARLGWVITVLAANVLVLPHLEPWPTFQHQVERILGALLVLTVAATLSALISACVEVLRRRDSDERLPFKVLGQALQMTVWTYAAVALLSVLTGRDVASVLTGLTAVGAVLVYVFRDPILGWTAGVQIAANDLLREGDWITVPKYGADGNVQEISLTTVKIRNWDKTVSSIPTYSLFSEGFRNWRGMSESGGRRIKRAIAIDATSVRFCDGSFLDRLNESPSIQALDLKSPDASADLLAGARLTNLSVFRTWLRKWLETHPKIHTDMTLMVRELDSNGRGIPVEIYAFSNDQRWEYYEKLQAEIFDQVVATLPEFDLRVFQEPTGEDLRSLQASPST